MEARRQRPAHKRNPSLRDNAGASDSVHADLPHIAALIADGEITVGILNPVGCVLHRGDSARCSLAGRA